MVYVVVSNCLCGCSFWGRVHFGFIAYLGVFSLFVGSFFIAYVFHCVCVDVFHGLLFFIICLDVFHCLCSFSLFW